jgi:hypothetical protein
MQGLSKKARQEETYMNIRIAAVKYTVVATFVAAPLCLAQDKGAAGQMPAPRQVSAAERTEIAEVVTKRFHPKVSGKFNAYGVGEYRFGGTDDFFVIERKDLGSVAFETKTYGTGKALDASAFEKEVLLPRIEKALREAGFDVKDKKFAHFQDEFVGAFHDRKALPEGFDPRHESKLVARSVAFDRAVEGLPVFGSELLVGLNPDGTIGRFRLHWPKLQEDEVKNARALQAEVRDKKWQLPTSLREEDTEVLEVTAGVGHSAFADPQFRSAAVVRVLYRRTAKGTEHPLVSTGFRYFDRSGKEVVFSSFPVLPGTDASLKVSEKKQY